MSNPRKGDRVLVSSAAGDETATVTAVIGEQVHFVTDGETWADRSFDWLPAWCVQPLTETSEDEMVRLLGLERDGILAVVR